MYCCIYCNVFCNYFDDYCNDYDLPHVTLNYIPTIFSSPHFSTVHAEV